MPLHIETPLVESLPLSVRAGRTVLLKLDALQPSGSFKTRGIGAFCEARAREGVRRFVSSSGGNAGMAVAYAGRRLGVPVTVVVPSTTTARAMRLIRAEGADVIVHGDSWLEAHAHAEALAGSSDAALAALVHPFDDPLIWTGHATMVDELARQTTKPDAIVVSVGGGGLFCGVVEGLRRNGWSDVRVIAVETEGAASLHQSLEAGERITLPAITSIATSLGAKQVCARAFDLARTHPTTSATVTDAAAVAACLAFVDEHRLVVEPACGAALALADADHPALGDTARIVIVVCGGATTGIEDLNRWREKR